MTNHEIAAAFDEIADLLEFQGANPFRVRAYRNAARTIHDLPESAADIAADPQRSLTDIEGIGKDLAEKIATLVETGALPHARGAAAPRCRRACWRSCACRAWGPSGRRILHHELNDRHARPTARRPAKHIASAPQGLRRQDRGRPSCRAIACRGRHGGSSGPRPTSTSRKSWPHMRACRAVDQIEAAGSYRRGKETVGDLDFLVVARDVAAAMDRLAAYGGRGSKSWPAARRRCRCG